MSAPRNLGVTATGLHAAEATPGEVLAGRFRIESLLGMGGMGVVYRAHDLHLDTAVAVKLLRPELAASPDAFERFRQELLLARQVSNPHVVRIHDIARHESRWLISMDLVDGQSLEKVIDHEGALAPERAIAILRQIAEGLAAAHRRGVVHRDLKPANVLLDADGNAYISDFGVARSLGASGLTQSGTVVGTPEYLSPEQARAEPADQRSDLYSLGLIGYEMLTGTLPFSGGTPAESALQRMVRPPPAVASVRSDLPPWIGRLIDRLLRTSPAHRFQSAEQLIQAIDTRRVPAQRPRALGWSLAGAALIALLLAGGIAWWPSAWWSRPAPIADAVVPERIVVLPIGGDDAPGDHADALRGLSEHLRSWIGSQHHGVVGGERTAQALALLGAERGTGAVEPQALHAPAQARIVIAGRWVDEPDERGHLRFDIHARGEPATALRGTTRPVAELAAAYRDAGRALVAALSLDPAVDPPGLPDDQRALSAYGAGMRARARGQPAEAVRRFNESTVAAPAFQAAWLALAESARAAGRSDAALTATLNGIRLVSDQDSLQAVRFEALRASLEGDPDGAAEALGRLAAQRPDDAEVALLLADAESDAGRFQQAAERLQRLVDIDPDDPRVWFLLGKVSILRGEARRAVDDYLVRALVLFNRSRNAVGQADTINALGVGYDRLGQIDSAIEQYRQAVELRRALGDPRGLASSLRNLAALAAVRGEFDQAASHLAEARELLEGLRDRQGLADLHNDLGLLAEERGDFAEALGHYRGALHQRQAIGHAHGVAESLNNIGFSHYQLGAWDDASVYWRQALSAFEALGDLTGIVRARQNLAVLAMARGDWAQAATGLEAALAEAQREQMVEEVAVALRYLAELALLRGRPSEALTRLDRAETLFAGREDQRGLVDVALLRARAAHLSGRPDDALALLEPLLADREALSVAQRAELLLVAAEAARSAARDSDAAGFLDAAAKQAAIAEVPLHTLHARLLEAEADGAGGADVLAAATRFGHAALLLRAYEVAMSHAIAAPADPAAARSHYRDALATLRRVGDWSREHTLHRLGAEALRLGGDAAAAAQAERDADAASVRLRGEGATSPATVAEDN